jgi:hypothetical protein
LWEGRHLFRQAHNRIHFHTGSGEIQCLGRRLRIPDLLFGLGRDFQLSGNFQPAFTVDLGLGLHALVVRLWGDRTVAGRCQQVMLA